MKSGNGTYRNLLEIFCAAAVTVKFIWRKHMETKLRRGIVAIGHTDRSGLGVSQTTSRLVYVPIHLKQQKKKWRRS